MRGCLVECQLRVLSAGRWWFRRGGGRECVFESLECCGADGGEHRGLQRSVGADERFEVLPVFWADSEADLAAEPARWCRR